MNMGYGPAHGLLRYDIKAATWTIIDTSNSDIASNGVLDILSDNSVLWIATTKGLNRYNPISDSWEHYNIAYGETIKDDIPVYSSVLMNNKISEIDNGETYKIKHLMDRKYRVHLRDSLVTRYAELIYYGYWFSPERHALQNLIDDIQRDVTGTVRIKLYKGNCYVVGRKAPRSLYNAELATFGAEDVYNQRDADGFIKLNALRLRLQTLKEGRKEQ